MMIPNRSWSARRDWHAKHIRRLAWGAQAFAERKWREQQAWEAAYEAAAEESMFEFYNY